MGVLMLNGKRIKLKPLKVVKKPKKKEKLKV